MPSCSKNCFEDRSLERREHPAEPGKNNFLGPRVEEGLVKVGEIFGMGGYGGRGYGGRGGSLISIRIGGGRY
jgi:hypothetical protein